MRGLVLYRCAFWAIVALWRPDVLRSSHVCPCAYADAKNRADRQPGLTSDWMPAFACMR